MKRYIVSSVVTFISAFCLAIYPMLSDSSMTFATFKASIFAIVFVGIRAGIKALIEFLFITPQSGEITSL